MVQAAVEFVANRRSRRQLQNNNTYEGKGGGGERGSFRIIFFPPFPSI